MKSIKVITTVGSSVFSNYQSATTQKFFAQNRFRNTCIATPLKSLTKNRKDSFNEEYIYNSVIMHFLHGIERCKDANDEFAWRKTEDKTTLNKNCCAEIQTIEAIALKPEFAGQELHIHLLTTETVLSNLAARIIEKAYEGHSFIKIFRAENKANTQYDIVSPSGCESVVETVQFLQSFLGCIFVSGDTEFYSKSEKFERADPDAWRKKPYTKYGWD
jgi:hypothetical protein